MARYRTAVRACCDHKSREYALSLCGVTFRDTLVLRVLRSPEHTITTNALSVSDSAGNVLSTNPKEKLGLGQRSGAADFRSKSYHVVSNRHSFPVLTIAVYSSYTVGSHKHQACSSRTPPRDIDLQWCLVEDTACPQSSFVSSVHVMCTCLTERQSPDLSIASRNGLRAISLCGRLGNHNAAPHCCKEGDWANNL